VNEPAATSCRGCGRWPSLFDLQDNAVGDTAPTDEGPARDVPRWEPEEVEAESAGDVGDAVPTSVPEPPPVAPSHVETRPTRRGRTRSPAQRLVRLIIPVAVLLYFLISSYLSNH
jgi:hypothetical protein